MNLVDRTVKTPAVVKRTSDEDESIQSDNESSSEDRSDTGEVANDQAEEDDSDGEGSVKSVSESESDIDSKLKTRLTKKNFVFLYKTFHLQSRNKVFLILSSAMGHARWSN